MIKMSQGEKVPEEKKIPKASLSFAEEARKSRGYSNLIKNRLTHPSYSWV